MSKHMQESLVHKMNIHPHRKPQITGHTHAESQAMRAGEDKCSINKSSSSITSFLSLGAGIAARRRPHLSAGRNTCARRDGWERQTRQD